jgi:DMSO/TMAO reductase YedYZ molybdopterin-dependent catalytic subunit
MAQQELTRTEVTRNPLNAETPLAALAQSLTSLDLVYIRNHFAIPELDVDSWSLEVKGAVGNRVDVSLENLREMPTATVDMVLECAGNGRQMMAPKPPGTPWGMGAVSRARFLGTPLRLLLERVEVADAAAEVIFVGADAGEVEPGRRESFARSLPLDVALGEGPLLAWEINGKPLPVHHGFPLRLVVPGWYGMASVKWLKTITVAERHFQGYFQSEHYVYWNEEGTPDGEPVRHIRPRALILSPSDGDSLSSGGHGLRGVAWSGHGTIERVLISFDQGGTWSDAHVEAGDGSAAMQKWSFDWIPPQSGRYDIAVRAVDAKGGTQPEASRWNKLGYGNNGPHSISVRVM